MLPTGFYSFKAGFDVQRQFSAAVIMPTIGRSTVIDAVTSIYKQVQVDRVQLLIGVDVANADFADLVQLLRQAPAHVDPYLFYPGYSTSARHGGLSPAFDRGNLRTILSYLANSRYLTYLDDDNWIAPNHLRSMLDATEGKEWCFSYRWFVEPKERVPLCVDTWESVGPGLGIFNDKFGGWTDPNTIMPDKLACEPVLRWWGLPIQGDTGAMSADRNVFNWLRHKSVPGQTNLATVYYAAQPQQVQVALKLINHARQS